MFSVAKLFNLGILMVALSLLGAGCATSRTSGWDKGSEAVTLSAKDKKELETKASGHWSKRHVKEELEKSLEAYETLSKSDPTNYGYLVSLCRGYYLLADGHYDDMNMKKKLWEKGVSFGESAMATNQAFREKVKKEEGKIELALDTLSQGEIESIYWTAVNLGKWGKAAGIATILKYNSRIKAMITKVSVLDPNFFHGAANRYWGAYYAAAPSFAGGDLKKSEESFKKSAEQQKDYLGTYVLMAEFLNTKKGDKEAFKKNLELVLKADPNKVSDIVSENLLEQAKAKKLMQKMDELF